MCETETCHIFNFEFDKTFLKDVKSETKAFFTKFPLSLCFVQVVSHMVRWYSTSKKVRKIVRRLKHNSHLEFGQQGHRAHSCGDLELIRCAVEDRSNGHQPPGAGDQHYGTMPRHKDMKDKIVEARPRRARSRSKSREDKERSKSRAESSGKGSLNGSKTDLSSSKLVNGDANKNKENPRGSPPILKSTKRRSESSPRMSRVDFSSTMSFDHDNSDPYSYRNLMKDIKNTKDIEELKAIIQHNSLESKDYV